MGIRTTGFGDARKILRKLSSPDYLRGVVDQPMMQSAESMMTVAKKRTPVDTGTLRASGRVYRSKEVKNFTVVLGFHTHYALYVHEDLQAHHPVGQAKYLESAVADGLGALEKRVAKALLDSVRKTAK